MKKYVYYQIHILATPETEKHLGKLLSFYAKDIIKEVVDMDWKELNSVPVEDVKQFYKQNKKQKTVYVDKETYEKWKQLPRGLKQQALYLINKKLMEVEL
jgi:dihydrofolate reductase